MSFPLSGRFLCAAAIVFVVGSGVAVPSALAASSSSPRVSSVSPRSGPSAGGTKITVRGSHFRSVRSVTVGGVATRKVHVVSRSKLTVIVPKHPAGRYSVRVRTTKGRSATNSHSSFGYVARPAVSKVRLVKGSGIAGSTIRITGKNLAGTAKVQVGRVTANVVSRGSNTVDVRVPANAPGRLHVTATTAGGTSVAQAADVYPMPAPVDQKWSIQTYLGMERGYLADVSCPTPTTCVAVDGYDSVWTITDGHWGEPVHLPGEPYYAAPRTISCATTEFCVVVGSMYAYIYENGSWTLGPRTSETGGQTAEVSCSSPGNCVVITPRSYLVLAHGVWSEPKETPSALSYVACFADSDCRAMGPGPSFYSFDGTTWTSLQTPPRYGASAASCASPNLCAVVTTDGWASTWDGQSWSDPAKLERGYDSFVAMSCVATTCVYNGRTSVHTYTDGVWTATASSGTYHLIGCHTPTECIGQDNLGRIGIFDGTAWQSTQQRLARVGAGSSLDCTDANFCAMSDEAGNAYVYDGTTWSAPQPIGSTYYQHSAVSCPTSSFCMASFADRATATWDGATWTAAPSTLHAALSLACFSPVNCIAAGRYGSERFNGTRWTAINSTSYRSMSCGSATFCAAVTSSEVQTFDGTRWHHAVDDPDLRYADPHVISCPTASFCLLIDGVGHEITYRAGTWSRPTATLSQFPMTVACSSATSCQALGFYRSQTYDGHNWSAINTSGSADEAGDASALSCYAPGACIAADMGIVFASQPLD